MLRRLKFLLFALVPCAALTAGLEVGLRSVGFVFNPHDLTRPMFVFKRRPVRRWETAPYYRDATLIRLYSGRTNAPVEVSYVRTQSIAAVKPRGTVRVALIGGSTVHDLNRAEPLQRLLAQGLGRDVEIINLGMPGTGSQRELLTLEEALRFSVDAVVYFSGHNEFSDMARTRSYLRPPLGMRPLYRDCRIAQLTWRIGQVFYVPDSPTSFWGLGTDHDELDARNLVTMPRFGPVERQAVVDDFEGNMRAIVARARAAQVPLVVCTAPYNLRLPPWTEYSPALFAHLSDAALAALAAADREQSTAAALVLAQRSLDRGQWDVAREAFEQALVTTRKPTRCQRLLNAAAERVAAEQQVLLVDLKRRIDAAAENGIPGSDLFGDHCHMQSRGYTIVQEELAAALLNLWRAPSSLADGAARISTSLTPFVAAKIP